MTQTMYAHVNKWTKKKKEKKLSSYLMNIHVLIKSNIGQGFLLPKDLRNYFELTYYKT
jgi:hypothetical protein